MRLSLPPPFFFFFFLQKHGEVKKLVQSHTGNKWRNIELSPDLSGIGVPFPLDLVLDPLFQHQYPDC